MPISPLVIFVPAAVHAEILAGTRKEIRLDGSPSWTEALEDPRGYFDKVIILINHTEGGRWRSKIECDFKGWTKETLSKKKFSYVIPVTLPNG